MLKYRRIWTTVGWLLILLVVYLSLTPHPPEPVKFDNSDKFEHALAYAALSFWLCQVYLKAGARAVVLLALIGMGIALEYVQRWTGYRTFDVQDMQADAVGVLLGWLLVLTPLGRLLDFIENRIFQN